MAPALPSRAGPLISYGHFSAFFSLLSSNFVGRSGALPVLWLSAPRIGFTAEPCLHLAKFCRDLILNLVRDVDEL